MKPPYHLLYSLQSILKTLSSLLSVLPWKGSKCLWCLVLKDNKTDQDKSIEEISLCLWMWTTNQHSHNGLKWNFYHHMTREKDYETKWNAWKALLQQCWWVSQWHGVFHDGDPLKETNHSISAPLMWPLSQTEPLHQDLWNKQLCNPI